MADIEDRRRHARSRRSVVFASTVGAGVLLVAAILGIVNYLAERHYQRFDWTESSLHSLSEKTRNILATLDQEIDVIVVMDPGSELYEPVQRLLASYAEATPKIEVRTIDPQKNLAQAQQLVQQYDIQRGNVVVFVGPDDRRVVEGADLAEYDYGGLQMGQGPRMTGFKGEPLFTGAIVELAEDEKPKVLFTTGHGEMSLDDATSSRGLGRFVELIGRDNFEVEEWATLRADEVPEETDLVVVAGPTAGFTEPELSMLGRFLDAGGRVLALLDPDVTQAGAFSHEAMATWLARYGVEIRRDLVVDPANPLPFFGADTIFAQDFAEHPITESLQDAGLPVLFALARSVARGDEAAGDVTELVKTSEEGWAETDLDNLGAVEKDGEDREGPVPLGVAVELASSEETTDEEDEASDQIAEEVAAAESSPIEERAGRLVVYGDSDFAGNGQLAQVGNATLAANTMNWLVERESHLGIPPKEPQDVKLTLTPDQHRLLNWLVLAGLPGLLALAGIGVLVRRRRG